MEQKITIADLADALCQKAVITHKDAENFVKTLFDTIALHLGVDKVVKIKGLGAFKLVDVDARESINVNTGVRFRIEGHTKISFTPDTALRDAVNSPFAEFETTVLSDATEFSDMPKEETSVDECPVDQVPFLEEIPVVEEPVPEEPIGVEPDSEEPLTVESVAEALVVEDSVIEDSVIEDSVVEDSITEKPIVEEPVPLAPEERPIVEEPVPAGPEAKEDDETSEKHHTCRWRTVWCNSVTALLIFALGYVAGHYEVLPLQRLSRLKMPTLTSSSADKQQPASTPVVQKQMPKAAASTTPKAVAPATPCDTTAATTAEIATKDSQKKLPSEVLAYPQVEGGEYLIVGIDGIDTMKVGRTLLNISIKHYRTKNMVPYICALNGITNPDVVPLGKELKLPKLKKR